MIWTNYTKLNCLGLFDFFFQFYNVLNFKIQSNQFEFLLKLNKKNQLEIKSHQFFLFAFFFFLRRTKSNMIYLIFRSTSGRRLGSYIMQIEKPCPHLKKSLKIGLLNVIIPFIYLLILSELSEKRNWRCTHNSFQFLKVSQLTRAQNPHALHRGVRQPTTH